MHLYADWRVIIFVLGCQSGSWKKAINENSASEVETYSVSCLINEFKQEVYETQVGNDWFGFLSTYGPTSYYANGTFVRGTDNNFYGLVCTANPNNTCNFGSNLSTNMLATLKGRVSKDNSRDNTLIISISCGYNGAQSGTTVRIVKR